MSVLPGCEIYTINLLPSEPDAIYVYEAWRSEPDHAASLKLESVRALITKGRPLIAGISDSLSLKPVGGKGISPA